MTNHGSGKRACLRLSQLEWKLGPHDSEQQGAWSCRAGTYPPGINGMRCTVYVLAAAAITIPCRDNRRNDLSGRDYKWIHKHQASRKRKTRCIQNTAHPNAIRIATNRARRLSSCDRGHVSSKAGEGQTWVTPPFSRKPHDSDLMILHAVPPKWLATLWGSSPGSRRAPRRG